MPGWFVFGGCSYEPAFYGKGRKILYKELIKNEIFQKGFEQLGSVPSSNLKTVLEKFVCNIYKSDEASVNAARAEIFEKKYRAYKGNTKNMGTDTDKHLFNYNKTHN